MSQQTSKTFDLIVEGVAYLSRVRDVKPKKGNPYLACTLNALNGPADSVEYVSIDCIVVGALAQKAVLQLKQATDDRKKVLVGFRAGDPRPEFYSFPDQKTGETVERSGLKARLLQLMFAKVDGATVDIPVVPRPSREPETA